MLSVGERIGVAESRLQKMHATNDPFDRSPVISVGAKKIKLKINDVIGQFLPWKYVMNGVDSSSLKWRTFHINRNYVPPAKPQVQHTNQLSIS